MAVTEISYPVTGSVGSYQNTFPSQKPLYAEWNRQDISISAITSGTDSKVQIQASANFTDIQLGQFIIFQSDGYSLTSAKVIEIVAADTIRLDLPFSSGNAANGWVNYHRNWFLEVRYLSSDSASNDQNAFEIIEDYSQISSAKSGDVKVRLNTPSQLIVPDFDLQTGLAENLFKVFKIQYRESYDGNRGAAWVSPSSDIPIMLVHGSQDIDVNEFTDKDLTKRYVRGYPLLYSLIYSGVNDAGSNSLRIKFTELDIAQNILNEDDSTVILNLNGVYLIYIDTNNFDEDTAFVTFSYTLSTDNSQYDSSQYDNTQYA